VWLPEFTKITMTNKTNEAIGNADRVESVLLAARRKKLERLAEAGIDPWGSRFDDRQPIGQIRRRIAEVILHTAAGGNIKLPTELGSDGFDFRGGYATLGKASWWGRGCGLPAASCCIAIRGNSNSSTFEIAPAKSKS
jgi:hypothetical protein